MTVSNSELIESFISSQVVGVDFNKTSHSGDHTGFIVSAARRRGLTVEQISPGEYVFFDGPVVVGGLSTMLTSLVSIQAIRLGGSKPVQKRLFKRASIPVPNGQEFERSEIEAARSYFEKAQVPVVLKPGRGKGGDGITVNVETTEQFDLGWQKALDESNRSSPVLIEEHVNGLDVRVFVVGDRVVAAATRLPAFVQGNGRDTLQELIQTETAKRSEHAYLKRLPISLDFDWIAMQGYALDSIPQSESTVTLNGTVNLHQGGEQIDVTHVLCHRLRDLAVNAAHAIPGLGVAGIDLLVRSVHSAEGAVVLEANHSANINVHHLPAYGRSVDVGAAIVEEMIRTSRNGRLVYF